MTKNDRDTVNRMSTVQWILSRVLLHLPSRDDEMIIIAVVSPGTGRHSAAGWSLGWVSAIDCEGRTIWIVDAHPDKGKRFVVHSD
jgi:hypothetical protein